MTRKTIGIPHDSAQICRNSAAFARTGPYPHKNGVGSNLARFLGDLELDSATEDEIDLAQDYLLQLICDTEDPETAQCAILDMLDMFAPDAPIIQEVHTRPSADRDHWLTFKDGSLPAAHDIFKRHYSYDPKRAKRGKRKSHAVAGPGWKLTLISSWCESLLVFRRAKYRGDDQWGVEIPVFRNEIPRKSGILASEMLADGIKLALTRWPVTTRLFTYVDSRKLKGTNAGFVFKLNGFKKCGETKKGLLIFEKIIPPIEVVEKYLPWIYR